MRKKLSRNRTKITALILLTSLLALMAVSGGNIFAKTYGYFWAYTEGRTMPEGSDVKVYVRGYDVSNVTMDVYSFDASEYFMSTGTSGYWWIRPENVKSKELVTSLTVPRQKYGRNFDSMAVIKSLPAGSYFVVLKSPEAAPNDVVTTWFTIGKFGIIAKQSKSKLLIQSVNVITGEPIPGAQIVTRSENSTGSDFGGTTDENGLFEVDLDDTRYSSMIIGKLGNEVAVMYSSSMWGEQKNKLYLYTDRPVYRPSQEVSFKGILRHEGETSYEVPGNKDVDVKVLDSKGNVIWKKVLTTNSMGSFDASFFLSSEPSLGYYTIQTEIDGEVNNHSFEVQEYRKPEWSVNVSFDEIVYITGDEVTCRVSAEYYFGAPVSDARVVYRIYRQQIGFIAQEAEQKWYDYSSYGRDYYYGEYVSHGETTMGEDGIALIKFVPQDANSHNYMYIAEVDVIDSTDRSASGRGFVDVAKGTFDVDIETDKYLVNKGESVNITLNSVDIDHNPVSRDFDVKIYKREWKKNKSIDTIVDTRQVTTNADGLVTFSYEANFSGTTVVIVESQDERGNKIKSETYLWVWENGASWASEDQQNVQVILDKEQYAVGEIAKVMITGPAASTHALITIEGKDIKGSNVIELTNGSAKIDLEVTEAFEPNVFVCATIVNNMNMVTGQEALNVDVDRRSMNIEVTSNKNSYKPQETAIYKIKTTNSAGQPISAELSFGLVDEAIYAIRSDNTEDIRTFFYGRKGNTVYTDNSFPRFYYGGTDKEASEDAVRKDFKDTAIWIPTVTTDANGEATVKVKLPDNLTTWRATIKAHNEETITGQTTHQIIVTKPVVARLSPPRFYTVGDTGKIVGVVHNYTDSERKFGVHLIAEGAKVLDGRSRYVTIPAGGQATVEWEVEPGSGEKAVFLMRARSWFLTDALQLEVPIIPFGDSQSVTLSAELSANVVNESYTFDVELPENRIEGIGGITLNISLGYEGVIAKALDYLANYPYGCVEQTMSAFLPNIVATELKGSVELSGYGSEEELAKRVDDGLQRLYRFQQSSGGWGWWEYGNTSVWMTSYVLYGLKRAQNAGYEVSQSSINSGEKFLDSKLTSVAATVARDLERKPKKNYVPEVTADEFAFGAYISSFAIAYSNSVKTTLNAIVDSPKTQAKTLAYISLAATNTRDYDLADRAMNKLETMVHSDGIVTYFLYDDSDMYWRNETVESTAWALLAMLGSRNFDKYEDMSAQSMQYLLSVLKSERWVSTRDSAIAIIAIVERLNHAGALIEAEDRRIIVEINGRQFYSELVKVDDKENRVIDISYDKLKAGNNTITVKKNGLGSVYTTLTQDWYEDVDTVPAIEQNISIKREYLKLDRDNFTKDKYGVVTFNTIPVEDGIVNVGEEIVVKVTIKADYPLEYMAMEDPLPSGFEVADESTDPYSWSYWYGRREVRDSKVVFFASYMEADKEYSFQYVITPERVGEFKVMPTNIWSMYYPDVKARTKSDLITVVPRDPGN